MEFLMNVNYTLVAVIILLIAMASRGYKRGMVSEITSFIAVVIGVLLIGLIIYGAKQVKNENYVFFIVVLVLFAILMFLIKVGKVLLIPMKLLSELAMMKQLDKVLGIVLGLIKAILYTWIIILLLTAMEGTAVAAYVTNCIGRSEFLMLISQNNYFEIWFKSLF